MSIDAIRIALARLEAWYGMWERWKENQPSKALAYKARGIVAHDRMLDIWSNPLKQGKVTKSNA